MNHRLPTGEEGDEVFYVTVQEYFSSLPMTMLTLVQFVSVDNVVLIYKPLVERDPRLAIYFMGLVAVVRGGGDIR